MGKGKKAKPRKDNSARIARGAARKETNRLRNELAHRQNVNTLASVGISPGTKKDRPSVQVRRWMRRIPEVAE